MCVLLQLLLRRVVVVVVVVASASSKRLDWPSAIAAAYNETLSNPVMAPYLGYLLTTEDNAMC